MSDILDMFIRMNKQAAAEIHNIESEITEGLKNFKNFRFDILKVIQDENNCNKPVFLNAPYKKKLSTKRIVESSSSDDDENNVSSTRIKLHGVTENVENTFCKPKRGAAKAASANIKKVSNMKLNSKMRRPLNEENTQSNSSIVKIEKRSESMLIEESMKSTALSDVTNENMPPPISNPKRARKKVKKESEEIIKLNILENMNTNRVTRSTRSKIKNQPTETKTSSTTKNILTSPNRKDSDVFIQETPIVVITVTDSESDLDRSSLKPIPKTNKKPETEIATNEAEFSKPEKPKRGRKPKNKIKLNIKEEPKDNTQSSIQEVSVYEDAVSENKTLDEPRQSPKNSETNKINNLNETHVLNKNSPSIIEKIKETGVQINCTVVLDSMRSTFSLEQNRNLNDTRVLSTKPPTPNLNTMNSDLLTDDEESIEMAAKTPTKKTVKTKPIFSPYGNSPVKKRVAAFERLGTSADVVTRVTRTKTRNLAANAAKSPASDTPLHVNRVISTAPSLKNKKQYTPLTNNKLASMIPQTDGKYKTTKNISVASSEASVKCLTAVKASRAELQERREEEQKRKQEHENEVKRKKEALLQAKIEEQKRKREEKQLKAQKAREAKEREKEEKIRKIIQEKEEKLQKEEQMKREWMNTMAKKAAEEEKRQQMLKLEKLELKRKLNKKPPPLPTDDLQDTDDEEENPKHKYVGPLWSQRQNLYPTLYTQRYVPSAITKEFFQMHAQTPDLLEIFETVHADILRRNSSAVWRTPPRYSTLPKF